MASITETLYDTHVSFTEIAEGILAVPGVDSDPEGETVQSIAGVNRFFDITKAIDANDETVTADEITDIGDHGLNLVSYLVDVCAHHGLNREKDALGQTALVIARWIMDHHGHILTLEPIVNGLADLANRLEDQEILRDLVAFMNDIIFACDETIRYDLENTELHRPWRLLHLNRGIVATRSQDPDMMRLVFDELIATLPLDAPAFFKQGMGEMQRLGYPEHVKIVMEDYLNRCDKPPMH